MTPPLATQPKRLIERPRVPLPVGYRGGIITATTVMLGFPSFLHAIGTSTCLEHGAFRPRTYTRARYWPAPQALIESPGLHRPSVVQQPPHVSVLHSGEGAPLLQAAQMAAPRSRDMPARTKGRPAASSSTIWRSLRSFIVLGSRCASWVQTPAYSMAVHSRLMEKTAIGGTRMSRYKDRTV